MTAFARGRVTASVYERDWTATDRLGNVVETYKKPADVSVLVAPASTSGIDDARPEGVRVALTLHFPKSWTDPKALRGAKVELPAPWLGTYAVVGIPEAYALQLSPLDLYLPVEVVEYDG